MPMSYNERPLKEKKQYEKLRGLCGCMHWENVTRKKLKQMKRWLTTELQDTSSLMRTMTSCVKVSGHRTWDTSPLAQASWAVNFLPLSSISLAYIDSRGTRNQNSRDARYWIFSDNRYADIFQLILTDSWCWYQYISFFLETTSLSCAEIINKLFLCWHFICRFNICRWFKGKEL